MVRSSGVASIGGARAPAVLLLPMANACKVATVCGPAHRVSSALGLRTRSDIDTDSQTEV